MAVDGPLAQRMPELPTKEPFQKHHQTHSHDGDHHHHHHPHERHERHEHCHHDHHHEHDEHDGCTHNHEGWRQYLPHSHSLETRLRSDTESLRIAFVILAATFVLQLVVGFIAKSSALMVEALHTALDGLTVVISLISVLISRRQADKRFSYGYARAEVLSALLSVLALALLCLKLFTTAVRRLWRILHGVQIVVDGKYVVIAEALTLVSNAAMALVLARGSSRKSLNLRALRAHVIADCIENVVVLIGGMLIWSFPGAAIVDPILSVVIVVLILFMNVGICKETVAALMQAAPSGILEGIGDTVVKLDGVMGVRRLHVWTLTSGFLIGSIVVSADVEVGMRGIKKNVRRVFEEFGVQNVTVQIDEAYEVEEEAEEEEQEHGADAGELSGVIHGANGYGPVPDDDESI